MLIHTEFSDELFSNVSGLGLIHCGLGLEKFFGPRPHFLASALASCPAGLFNIPGYLLPVGRSAANLQAAAAVDRWDRQTDARSIINGDIPCTASQTP